MRTYISKYFKKRFESIFRLDGMKEQLSVKENVMVKSNTIKTRFGEIKLQEP